MAMCEQCLIRVLLLHEFGWCVAAAEIDVPV
jgi:hypothetical protein